MERNPVIVEIVYTLVVRFVSFDGRSEVFIDHNADICNANLPSERMRLMRRQNDDKPIARAQVPSEQFGQH